MLPGKNGYEVCRDLRAAGNETPILMLTAKVGEYDEAEAFDTGADDYLRKPFSLVVLLARLRLTAPARTRRRADELRRRRPHRSTAASSRAFGRTANRSS